MILKDLTMAFIGDSITEGVGATLSEFSFPSIFFKNTDIKKAINYGVSGTRIARQNKTFMDYHNWDNDFIARVDTMEDDFDCIVVCGGINDYMHGDAELGFLGDCTEYTFYGALNVLIKKLKMKFPKAVLIFMTPIPFVEDKSFEYAHINKGHYFYEYLDAIKAVCEYHSVILFDLYSEIGIDSKNEDDRNRFYSDTIHLNDNGYSKIAEKLEIFLKNLTIE